MLLINNVLRQAVKLFQITGIVILVTVSSCKKKEKEAEQRIRSRWNGLKPKITALPDAIPAIEKKLSVSQVRNFMRWNILGRQTYLEMYNSGTWAGDVKYLKDFLANHIAWLDTKFNGNEYQ